ncbi:acid phosphatase [Rhodoferax sp. 4810]|nr:acid phosphatase [Rhodoferax jenense]
MASALALGSAAQGTPPSNTTGPSGSGVNNALLYSVAWKQTAAEYRALYFQGFNVARMHVELALAKRQPGDKPLAVVTDMDDTVLHALNYWGHLVNQNKDYFDDPIWDSWIPENKVTASPGSLDFLKFCADNGVQVFYVTSREQGEKTYEYALGHLKVLGFPYADEKHLTVLRDTSNKEKRQDEIMKDFSVVVFLGDNLNDFRRKYYIKAAAGKDAVDERMKLMEADRDKFGRNYIVFPNPTDGHWLAAIFGDSEPPPTDANREIMKKAATRSAWKVN